MKTTLQRKGIVAAMEEIDGAIEPQELPENTVPAAQFEADQAVTQVEQHGAEIDEMIQLAEEAIDDIGTLTEAQNVLQASVDEGKGVGPEASEMAQIVTESICARLGIRSTKRVIPAKENFGAKGSKIVSTQVAVENMGSAIERAWQGLKNFFAKIAEKAIEFIASFQSNVEKVQKEVDEVKKKVVSFNFADASAEISIPAKLATDLCVDNKLDKDATQRMFASHSKTTTAFTTLISVLKNGFEIVARNVKKATGDGGGFSDEDVSKLKDEAEKMAKAMMEGYGEIDISDKTIKCKCGPFVGGVYIIMENSVSADSSADGFKFEVKRSNVPVIEDKSVARLSEKDCNQALEGAEEILKGTADLKSALPKIKAIHEESNKLIESVLNLIGALGGNDHQATKQYLDQARKTVSSNYTWGNRIMTYFPVMNVKYARSMTKLVELSVS